VKFSEKRLSIEREPHYNQFPGTEDSTEEACKKSVERKMNKMPQEYFHPGTCEATERGKRYGKNLTPQLWDDPGHQWKLAKDTNWGAWSCCGCIASSRGCQLRVHVPPPSLVGMKIKFLDTGNVCRVIADLGKNWRLDDGRIAKKKTEGKVWAWVDQA
jgi:hypothetical protein